MSTVYGDVPKSKSNLDLCTNPIGVPVLGLVMLNPLESQSLLASFSTSRLSIKQCSSLGLDILSLSFWQPNAKREPKKFKEREKEGFYSGFLGFECKER